MEMKISQPDSNRRACYRDSGGTSPLVGVPILKNNWFESK